MFTVESFDLSLSGRRKTKSRRWDPAASQQKVAGMSHHVTRGRQLVFGTAPAGADAGAPKSAAIPVGIMIRCFTIAYLCARRRQIGLSAGIRQGN
jgi:hypothetical protein